MNTENPVLDLTVGAQATAIEDAVYAAVTDLMNAAGHYPTTRADILDAIRDGVRLAFADLLKSTTTNTGRTPT